MPRTSPRWSVNVAPGCDRSPTPRGSPRRAGEASADRARRRRRPTIRPNDVGGRESAVIPPPAILPSRSTTNPVGDCLHLFDEVRDVDDRVARAFQPAMRAKSLCVSACARLLVGSSSTSTRQPDGERARDLDELLGGGGERAHRRVGRDISGCPSRASAAAAVCRISRAPNQAEPRRLHAEQDVLQRRSGAARARAPGRSSPRRRARVERVARAVRGRRRATSCPRRAAGRPTGSPSACSCRRRSGRRARTPRRARPTTSTPSSATVAPNAFRMPRISKRGVP